MTNVGYATLSVIPSMKGFSSAVERQLAPQMAQAGSRAGLTAGREVGKGITKGASEGTKSPGIFSNIEKGAAVAGVGAGRRFGTALHETVGEYAKTIGTTMLGFLAFEKIKDVVSESISGASDLAESANKIQVVFGGAAKQVEDFASGADKALGQTELQARDAAATFGVFGKAAGLTGSHLAGFSTKLTSLAGDMASFYNTSPDQAIEALGAAMRGESEPIRAYGVLLDDASLRQQALKMGLVDTTKNALTPQQRVLAAYKLIMKQTADAQGDFQRTSGGLANQQRILSATFKDMEAQAGQKVLPLINGLAHAANNTLLPALGAAGSGVGALAQDFGKLPVPIKAAAGAWAAYAIAQKVGLTGFVAGRVTAAASALDTLRLRLMLTRDAYVAAREGQVLMQNGLVSGFVPGVGKASAALSGLKAGATGVGSALSRGLKGALSIVGGPWGAAFIGGAALVAHFWHAQQEAKQHVDELTQSLNQQTGALTEQTHVDIFKGLQDSGAIDAAKQLGINLRTVQQAAEGNKAAQDQLNESTAQYVTQVKTLQGQTGAVKVSSDAAKAADRLRDAVGLQSGALTTSRQKLNDQQEALGRAKKATEDDTTATRSATGQTRRYAGTIQDAWAAIVKLNNAENKRRLSALQGKQDQLSLIEQMQATSKEAAKGRKTLDLNTKAGQANYQALLDLVNQYDNSTKKVRAKNFEKVREELIKDAGQMHATKKQTQELVDLLVKPIKDVNVGVKTPGMKKALDDLKRLREMVKNSKNLAAYVNLHEQGDRRLAGARALGGPVVKGSTYLVGERGPELFTAQNSGNITPNNKLNAGGGVHIENQHIHGVDPWAWKRDQDHMRRAAALGGADFT